MDGTPLGTHHAPAAFGLHSPQRRQHAWAKPAKASAMGDLIKAIFGRYGTDLNRFKQQVMAFVAQSSEVPDISVGQGESVLTLVRSVVGRQRTDPASPRLTVQG